MPYRPAEPFGLSRLLAPLYSPVYDQIATNLPGEVDDGSSWGLAVGAPPLNDVEMIPWSAMSMACSLISTGGIVNHKQPASSNTPLSSPGAHPTAELGLGDNCWQSQLPLINASAPDPLATRTGHGLFANLPFFQLQLAMQQSGTALDCQLRFFPR